MIISGVDPKTIPISELRKRFGEIETALPYVDYFVLTKKGRPFATLSATSEVKKNIIKKLAGSFRNTDIDNDKIWRLVLKRKSRKKPINL